MNLDKQESLEHHLEKEEANLQSDSSVESYGHFATYEQTIKDDVMILTFNNFIRHNAHLFRGKVVLDLECGVGVLSMFAAKAGAAKVISVEKSNIVEHARRLVQSNNLSDKVEILQGKIEEIRLPDGVEKVDIIISQWTVGDCVFYESVMESVLFARDKYLAPGGLVFPDRVTFFISGLEDRRHKEENFDWWNSVHGFNMSSIRAVALTEPEVALVNKNRLVTNNCLLREINLMTLKKEDIPFETMFQLHVKRNDYIHALVVYFEVEFTHIGSSKRFGFSTAPEAPYTKWRQTKFYLDDYLSCAEGELVNGVFKLKSVKPRELDIDIDVVFQVMK